MNGSQLPLGQCATLACLWEATAPKPGNVHRGADFDDMTFGDFVTNSVAIGRVFADAADTSIGQLNLAAVDAMRSAVDKNTHLGAILLLSPLAVAARGSRRDVAPRAGEAAQQTTIEDCRLTYLAIRRAAPGGLGEVDDADVRDEPELPLHQAMRLAADRDLVARQYANGFQDVQAVGTEILTLAGELPLSAAIVAAHVRQLARCPDSLIARKCGDQVAEQAAARAGAALEVGPPGGEAYHHALGELDFWLRSDGRRRNPGTTADLVAAALFLLLAEGRLAWPVQF